MVGYNTVHDKPSVALVKPFAQRVNIVRASASRATVNAARTNLESPSRGTSAAFPSEAERRQLSHCGIFGWLLQVCSSEVVGGLGVSDPDTSRSAPEGHRRVSTAAFLHLHFTVEEGASPTGPGDPSASERVGNSCQCSYDHISSAFSGHDEVVRRGDATPFKVEGHSPTFSQCRTAAPLRTFAAHSPYVLTWAATVMSPAVS